MIHRAPFRFDFRLTQIRIQKYDQFLFSPFIRSYQPVHLRIESLCFIRSNDTSSCTARPYNLPNIFRAKVPCIVKTIGYGLLLGTLCLSPGNPLAGAEKLVVSEIQAFAEPYRTIEVAAVESGLMTKLHIEEGDAVEKNQTLAELHNDVQKATLEVAKAQRDATTSITIADLELRLRETVWHKFKELRRTDHASEEETLRAELEYEIAKARSLQASEQLQIRKLEYERAEFQLACRTIRSPITGVITQIHREAGEYLSPADPVVATIVQLDPLTIVFSVPASMLNEITRGQKLVIRVEGLSQTRQAEVETVSPIINAESQTVRVKLSLPNSDRSLRSGVRCFLPMQTPTHRSTEKSVSASKANHR